MRLIILVLNIVVGSTLLGQPAEVLAASVDATANKKTHLRGHATHLRGKGKESRLHRAKHKITDNPGDVWERIRSGMQIPRPSPVQTQPGLAFAQKGDGLPKTAAGQTPLNMRPVSHLQLHRLNTLILSETGGGHEQ